MPFPKKLLNDYEKVSLDLHPHWMYFAEPVAALVGIIVVTIVGAVLWDPPQFVALVAVAALIAAAIWLFVRYLKWSTTNFVITSDRIIFREGVLAKRGIEIPLERVNNVNFNQSIFERMTGCGDLLIESAGADGAQRFSDVRHPEKVQNLIHAEMEDNENRKFDRVGRGLGAPMAPPAAPDLVGQLERLEQLYHRGSLTQAEWEAQKAKLLGGA
jgi:uncharacterized membrane protein YdbT with pleckstrin-like domain